MQNFPNPQTPSGGMYGNPPPAKKPGLSKGCLTGIIATVVLFVVGSILLLVGGGIYWFKLQAEKNANSTGRTTNTSSSSGANDGSSVQSPSPTSAQTAAVAGGQSVAWEQQEISWTVPQKWSKSKVDSRTFVWRSPGSSDAASLIASFSPTSTNYPVETSLNAMYQGAQTRKQNGDLDEVRWLNLGGVKGVQFRETAPENADSPQRLQWMGYRTYKGQTQMVNIILASRGKAFARHEDALYGILYTTKFSQ